VEQGAGTRGRTRPTAGVSAFATEAQLHAAVVQFLTRLQVPYRSQYPVGDGRADIALELADGRPWCLLELKLTHKDLSLADAADYFEQAVKYRLESTLPVFVGPFLYPHMGVVDALYEQRHPVLSALSALGGRLDVGLFFLHCLKGYEAVQQGWYGFQLVLRQQRVATFSGGHAETIWPREPLSIVDLRSAGSRKDRG
jgi:hypothetical protein